MSIIVSDFQQHFNAVVEASERLGLHIKNKKTKCMVVSKSEIPPICPMKQGEMEMQQVSFFSYFGARVRCNKKIRRRIGIAKDTLLKLRDIATVRKVPIKIKSDSLTPSYDLLSYMVASPGQ